MAPNPDAVWIRSRFFLGAPRKENQAAETLRIRTAMYSFPGSSILNFP